MVEDPQPILVPLALAMMLLVGIGLLTGHITPATLAGFYHAALSGVVHK